MAEEFDYLLKIIIMGDKEVGKTTLFKYINKPLSNDHEQRTLEKSEEFKKEIDKEIDYYLILMGKTRSRFKRKVTSHKIDKLNERKTTLGQKIYGNNSTRLVTGADICAKDVKIREKVVKLQIWILSTQERFRSIFQMYIRGSLGAIIMYDITNLNSLKRISEWCKTIRENSSKIPILLVGNKLDLEYLREISIEQGTKIKEELQLSAFMEISIKTGENVERMFERLSHLGIAHLGN